MPELDEEDPAGFSLVDDVFAGVEDVFAGVKDVVLGAAAPEDVEELPELPHPAMTSAASTSPSTASRRAGPLRLIPSALAVIAAPSVVTFRSSRPEGSALGVGV
ncbi:MAG TPA: hypothetical protein VII01_15085 [Solirubrobacteraceae bacterium]